MRKLIYTAAVILCVFALHSCAEDVLIEELSDETTLTASLQEKTSYSTENCSFNLADLKANTEKVVSCLIDLQGETISLNENITLIYDGGDIVNGTLIFTDGKIDGRLLNQSLQVNGDASLTEPTFKFDPSRWDLTEGRTTFRNAFHNRLRIEELMTMVKQMNGNTFEIDAFDAYFEV
ncbi:MAG: hypothetical protein WA951_13965, partial [Leeuwenhoekiella sp.]